MSAELYEKIMFNSYDAIMNKCKISGITNSGTAIMNIFNQQFNKYKL